MSSKKYVRLKLTHGSARVSEDCSLQTIEMLDKLSRIAYKKIKNKNCRKISKPKTI